MIRTTKRTVTFARPFVLGGFDEVLPAGAYTVETDEELLDGISFPAYRRIRALVHLHPKPGRPGITQVLTIDPNELDAALSRDREPARLPAETEAGPTTRPGRASEPDGEELSRRAIERAENEGMTAH